MEYWMFGIVMVLLVIDVIYLTTWTVIDGFYRSFETVTDQPEYKCFQVSRLIFPWDLPFFGWENGISCTGSGIHQQEKTIENGNGTKILRRDLWSGTMGFSQSLGWEMGIGSPLQDPLKTISEGEGGCRLYVSLDFDCCFTRFSYLLFFCEYFWFGSAKQVVTTVFVQQLFSNQPWTASERSE